MANPFLHVELQTSDPAKAKEFYRGLFDWSVEEFQEDKYTMIQVGKEGIGGGIMKSPLPEAPSHWLPYVKVEDVNASTEKAKALGAKVLIKPTQIGEYGAFSEIIDPTGAELGLWQPKSK